MKFPRYTESKRKNFPAVAEHYTLKESIKGKHRVPFVGGGFLCFEFEPAKALPEKLVRSLLNFFVGL